MVKVGLEILLENELSTVSGKRVGLITTPTGVDSRLNSNVDLLLEHGVRVTALFGPEHGVRGDAQAGESVQSGKDPKTGLPVYSLYGPTKKPTKEMLDDVDVLIFDMQDVGCRYYTFLYTLAYAQEAAAEMGKEFVVLDRPNPLGGLTVEGNLVKGGFTSFVGGYSLPIRYGLTIGEFSLYLERYHGVGKKPKVIMLSGWKRGMYFGETALPWVLPSPNIPTVDTAFVYPGTCLFEGTNLSEGRGTTKPFEIIGAPWLDGFALADRLNSFELPGVIFRPVFFTPTFSKHQGTGCQGVQLHITDYDNFAPVRTALFLLSEVFKYQESRFLETNGHCFFDLLAGDKKVREKLTAKAGPQEIWEEMESENRSFVEKAKSILLY